MIVCADAQLESTLDWVLLGIFQNTGQVCSATSRLLVHKDVYDTLVPRIIQQAKVPSQSFLGFFIYYGMCREINLVYGILGIEGGESTGRGWGCSESGASCQ